MTAATSQGSASDATCLIEPSLNRSRATDEPDPRVRLEAVMVAWFDAANDAVLHTESIELHGNTGVAPVFRPVSCGTGL
jgi:hypothetical protein